MTSRLRIVVSGLIGQHRLLGGITWHYVQYLAGLAALGHDVFYVEDSGEWPYNLDGGSSGTDWVERNPYPTVDYLRNVMARFGFESRWAYHFPPTGEWFGLSDGARRRVIASCDLVVNVSGTLERPEQYRDADRLVYIDSDPVFTQLRLTQNEHARRHVDSYDVHFSFGELLPSALPPTGHNWRPTRQPIVLEAWRVGRPTTRAFTTVMNLRSYEPREYEGLSYGQKDTEFLRFIELPTRAGAELEIAIPRLQQAEWEAVKGRSTADFLTHAVEQARGSVRELLARNGWRASDAITRCGDLESYRAFIAASRAEWSIAKNGYVRGRPGWFSERSACYLAAGRPVIAQDTGFEELLPTGEGLFSFRDIDGAANAIETVNADYGRHCTAAREVAREYFDSARVLTRLIEDATAAPQHGAGAPPLARTVH